MAKIPTDIFNNQITSLGELVTLKYKTESTYSDWGDSTDSISTVEDIRAIYNVYGRDTAFVDEGNFKNGTLTFYFRSDQDYIENLTTIIRANGEVFSIKDTLLHGVQGITSVKEAIVEKI